MTDLTREERMAAGLLVDVSDIASNLGVVWDMAISEDLERWLLGTFPPTMHKEDAPANSVAGVVDVMFVASAAELITKAMDELVVVAGDRPDDSRFTFTFSPSWKEGESKPLRFVIDKDGDGTPCFTLALESESA